MSKPRPRGPQSYRVFWPTRLKPLFHLPWGTQKIWLELWPWRTGFIHPYAYILILHPKKSWIYWRYRVRDVQDKQTSICKIRPERKIHFLCHFSILLHIHAWQQTLTAGHSCQRWAQVDRWCRYKTRLQQQMQIIRGCREEIRHAAIFTKHPQTKMICCTFTQNTDRTAFGAKDDVTVTFMSKRKQPQAE